MPNPLQPFDAADYIRATSRDIDGINLTRASGYGNVISQSFPLYPLLTASWPSTTSGTFTSLWAGRVARIWPCVSLGGWVNADAATVGELRVLVGGSQVGPVVAIPAGAVTFWEILRQEWPDGVAVQAYLEVQARRTSGAGAVSIGMNYLRSENASAP